MIQLYDKLPPELGLGEGMYHLDSGEYCKMCDAQRLLNIAMAQLKFIRPLYAPSEPWSNYRLPPVLQGGIIYSHGVAFCNAMDAQRLLERIETEVEFWGSHIPDVGSDLATWNKPVRC